MKNIINADVKKDRISKYIFSHFAEHPGKCIYGDIRVGEYSEFDPVNGYRKDVVEALKQLDIPNLRWPGGCFAASCHWMDGIGPIADRPGILCTYCDAAFLLIASAA